MNYAEIQRLLRKGRAGMLTAQEQEALADECDYYRNAALRTERAIHEMSKVFEKAGIM